MERGRHPDDRGTTPDFLQMGVTNALGAARRRDDARVTGGPVPGRPRQLPGGGVTDHICPWTRCYRSTQLLGGSKRFVLSTSGHIAAMVNPPGNEKARYQVAKECPEDPQEWLRHAANCRGSWWPDYGTWLAERCGEETAAPTEPGGAELAPMGDVARDLLHATTRLGPARGYYYQLVSSIGWTSLPRLPWLRQPTLILAGDDDPIIPLINARIMYRLTPRSELHIYHGGQLELAADAESMAPIVEAFLTAERSPG